MILVSTSGGRKGVVCGVYVFSENRVKRFNASKRLSPRLVMHCNKEAEITINPFEPHTSTHFMCIMRISRSVGRACFKRPKLYFPRSDSSASTKYMYLRDRRRKREILWLGIPKGILRMCKYSFLGRFVDGTIIKNASYEVGIPCHLHTTTINTSCERIYFKCVTEYKLCLLPLSHVASILLIWDVNPQQSCVNF